MRRIIRTKKRVMIRRVVMRLMKRIIRVEHNSLTRM